MVLRLALTFHADIPGDGAPARMNGAFSRATGQMGRLPGAFSTEDQRQRLHPWDGRRADVLTKTRTPGRIHPTSACGE